MEVIYLITIPLYLDTRGILPFEFPIFQILTKLFSSIFSIELTLTGRLLNLIIGIFNFLISLKVLSKYNQSTKSKYIFFILYFSSGIYLYWNRAFLIENTALLFSLLALNLYLGFRKQEEISFLKVKELLYFFVFLTFGLLSKATTSASLLAYVFLDQIYLNRKNLIWYEFKISRRKN